jgi:hypothetical protein
VSPQRSRSTRSTSGGRRSPARAGGDGEKDPAGDDGELDEEHRVDDGDAQDAQDGAPTRGRSRRRPLRDILVEARDQLEDLLGRPAQAVTSVEREEDGWLVQVEVLELERIPASTSILGLYEVHLDGDGDVLEYNRVGRYYRNQADEGDS